MTKIYDPYDVMAARKTDPAARYVLATDYEKLEAELEQWKTGSAHEAHFGDEARRDLAAANATLDRLREVVPEGDNTKWSSWQMVTKIHAILYPTPENDND